MKKLSLGKLRRSLTKLRTNTVRAGNRKAVRAFVLAAGMVFVSASPIFAQVAFTPGDLVVSTYGVGGGFMDGVPTPISLEEFTTSGTFVTTDTLPTTDSGGNFGIVGEYGSSSEANLQLTGDGHELLIGGYQADASYAGTGLPGGNGYSNLNGDALAQSTDTAVPRVFAEIGANGVASVTTQVNDIYSTNNPRSLWSATGSTLYLSGQGSSTADQGIYTVPVGTNTVAHPTGPTPTPIYTTTDSRIVQGYNNNLYYSVDKKNLSTGIFMYTGLPTSNAAVATRITAASNGLTGTSLVNYSPDGFWFANSTTLYVADTGLPKNKGVSDGGIQKWVLTGSTWSLDYTLPNPTNFVGPTLTSAATNGETGFESITGEVVGGQAELFAVSYTAGDSDEDGLYAIGDNIAANILPGNETYDELATAPGLGATSSDTGLGGAVFKSVSFAPTASAIPEPGTYAALFGAAAALLAVMKRKIFRQNLQN